MCVQRLRFWLPLLSIVLFLGSAAVLAYSLMAPCAVEVPSAGRPPKAQRSPPEAAGDQSISLVSLERLFARGFQGPLYDPPPEKPPVVVEEKKPPPQVKLLATMPEPGGGSAMLSDRNGSILIKALGGDVEDGQTRLQLVEIGNDHIVLQQGDERFTLTLGKG